MPDRPWKDEYTLLCEKCGYVIEGLEDSKVCPECGHDNERKRLAQPGHS